MYLLQSCITFCTVYNKGSCFLFLPGCLGPCFACSVGCCQGWEGASSWACGGRSGPRVQPITQGMWGHVSFAGAGTRWGSRSPGQGCPVPSPSAVAPRSGCGRGFHKATSSERIHLKWGQLLPSKVQFNIASVQKFLSCLCPLCSPLETSRAKAGGDFSVLNPERKAP